MGRKSKGQRKSKSIETNMESVKSVAKTFLYLDIETTKLAGMLFSSI